MRHLQTTVLTTMSLTEMFNIQHNQTYTYLVFRIAWMINMSHPFFSRNHMIIQMEECTLLCHS